jgi:hypothetical protein
MKKLSKEKQEALIEKWRFVLEYDGIRSDSERLSTAVILESQEKWCVDQKTEEDE